MTPGPFSILKSYGPIRLDEMDNVRLMNRVDIKYLMHVQRIPEFLKMLDGAYRVLEINDERIFLYNTIYLDTSDYVFFSQHVTGRYIRSKVRYRTYLNSGCTFL